jgi:endonuclease-3 related protein
LSIRGVGPETADSILLYAGGRPVFVVDAYTRRIGERIGWLDPAMGYEEVRAFFEESLDAPVEILQECHALFVELAKRRCRKREPDCASCEIQAFCRRGEHEA